MVVAIILGLALLLFFAPSITNVIAKRTDETALQQQERKDKEKSDQMRREDEGFFTTTGRIIFGNKFIEEAFGDTDSTIPELEEAASNTLGREVKFSENTTISKNGKIESDKSPTFTLSENDIIAIKNAQQKQSGRKSTNFGGG